MKIRHILFRDLRILLSDKKTLAVILLMPIILTSILSFALAGVFGDDEKIPEFSISVVKMYEDTRGDKALEGVLESSLLGSFIPESVRRDIIKNAADADLEKMFFKDFLGSDEIKEIMTFTIDSKESALDKLENDEISAVVVLPENFLEATYVNMYSTYQSRMEVEIIRNPERSITPDIAVSIIQGFFDKMASAGLRKNIAIETFLSQNLADSDTETISSLIKDSMDQSLDVSFIEETASGKSSVNSKSYYSVSMLTLFLLFSAGRGSYMLLEEKRDFTYQRMLTAGVSKWRILFGKFLVVFFIVIFQLLLLILYSTCILGVTWGNFFELSVVSLFTAFAVAGLGSLLAVVTFISDKTRIAGLFESVIFQVMGLIGGAYIPVEVLPSEIQNLSKVPLNGVALKAYLSLMTGSGIGELTEQLGLLALNGIVFAGLAIYLMSKKGEERHAGSNQAQTVGA